MSHNLAAVENKVLEELKRIGQEGVHPKELHTILKGSSGYSQNDIREALYRLSDDGTISIDCSLKIKSR